MSAHDTGREVATNIAKTPESEQHNALVNAVADAYGDLKDPKEYRDFFKGMTEGFGNNTDLVHDLQIVNSQGLSTNDGDNGVSPHVVEQAATNKDRGQKLNLLYELNDIKDSSGNSLFDSINSRDWKDSLLYRTLPELLNDNPYSVPSILTSAGVIPDSDIAFDSRANDGKITEDELKAYLEDANDGDPDSTARKFFDNFAPAEQEKLKGVIQGLIDTDLDEGITEDTVKDTAADLGFDNPYDEQQRKEFQTYFGTGETGDTPSSSTGQGAEELEKFDNGGIYSFTDSSGNKVELGVNTTPSGEVDAFNRKNADGTEEQFKLTNQGWMRFDSNGQNPQPWSGMAPDFKLQDGKPTFAWYERDPNRPDDPNAIVKRGFESNGNPINMELSLDPNAPDNRGKNPDGTPVAIEDLNRTPTGPVESQTNIGELPVTFKPGYEKLSSDAPDTGSQTAGNSHAENTIKTGTNLTEIARQLLKGRPGENDQQAINKIIDQLVDFNKIDDPNLIYADAQLKIPVDLQY